MSRFCVATFLAFMIIMPNDNAYALEGVPVFQSSTYNTETKVLTLTFDEEIATIEGSVNAISGIFNGAHSHPLRDYSINSNDRTSISVTLSDFTLNNGFDGVITNILTESQLSISAGTVISIASGIEKTGNMSYIDEFNASIEPAPTVLVPLLVPSSDIQVSEDIETSLPITTTGFVKPTFEVTLRDGSPAPDYISINNDEQRITINPPFDTVSFNIIELDLTINAKETESDTTATNLFGINVIDTTNDNPSVTYDSETRELLVTFQETYDAFADNNQALTLNAGNGRTLSIGSNSFTPLPSATSITSISHEVVDEDEHNFIVNNEDVTWWIRLINAPPPTN